MRQRDDERFEKLYKPEDGLDLGEFCRSITLGNRTVVDVAAPQVRKDAEVIFQTRTTVTP